MSALPFFMAMAQTISFRLWQCYSRRCEDVLSRSARQLHQPQALASLEKSWDSKQPVIALSYLPPT